MIVLCYARLTLSRSDLRSLEPIENELFARWAGPPTKSSAGGKQGKDLYASHVKRTKLCKLKLGGSKGGHKGKRELVKRVVKEVEAGTSEEGTSADELVTWNLKTCIGIAATGSGGLKALAHINGINAQGQDYKAQLAAFRTKVGRLGSGVKLHISYPDDNEGGANNKPMLMAMIAEVTTFADGLDPNYGATGPRALGSSGRMEIDSSNQISSC